MEFKFKFDSLSELDAWFDYCCTRCAMCNRDNGRNDPCSNCRANKVYETKKDNFERRNNK